MKKVLAIIITVALLFSVRASSRALEPDSPSLLSQMSEEECIEFVLSNGVKIPDQLKNHAKLGSLVKHLIQVAESNPNHKFVINYYPTYQLANDIKSLVKEYYCLNNSLCSFNQFSRTAYTLQYSTVVGPWSNLYEHYNCYGYVLGDTDEFPHPGFYSNSDDYSPYLSVEDFADLTEADLRALGYNCVVRSTSFTVASNWDSSYTVICLRKDITTGSEDFHYMRLIDGYWYHKPSDTHLLKYNYTSPHDGQWTNECSFEGYTYAPTSYYTSNIHYFAFSENHNFVIDYTGDDYHSGKQHFYYVRYICTGCGHSYYDWKAVVCLGPPCELQYVSIPNDPVIFSTK